jgi:E3 ubiquitin-protein ligase SHPRH
MASQFNDATFKVDCLVTSYRTCSVGVNLHKACTDVVLMEPAISANVSLQAIGRVHRIGQTKPQEIHILFSDHTFNRSVWLLASKAPAYHMSQSHRASSRHEDDKPNRGSGENEHLAAATRPTTHELGG